MQDPRYSKRAMSDLHSGLRLPATYGGSGFMSKKTFCGQVVASKSTGLWGLDCPEVGVKAPYVEEGVEKLSEVEEDPGMGTLNSLSEVKSRFREEPRGKGDITSMFACDG